MSEVNLKVGSADLVALVKWAKLAVIPPAQWEAQRRSFAYGNLKIENPSITRALVDQVAEETQLIDHDR